MDLHSMTFTRSEAKETDRILHIDVTTSVSCQKINISNVSYSTLSVVLSCDWIYIPHSPTFDKTYKSIC